MDIKRRAYYNLLGGDSVEEVNYTEIPSSQIPYSKDLAKKVQSLKDGNYLLRKNEYSIKGMVVFGISGLIIAKVTKQNMLLWSLGLGLSGLVLGNLLGDKMKQNKNNKVQTETNEE